MSRGRRAGDPGRRDARRAELLSTAVEVIRRKGPESSIDDIARAVGVTRPIIYRFFGSRDGVAAAVGAHTVDRVRQQLVAAMAEAPDPRAALAAGIDAYLAFIEAEPGLYRYLVRGPRGSGIGSAMLGDFVGRLGREIAVVLGEVLRNARRDTGLAEPWAFAIIGSVGLVGEWWLDRGAMSRVRAVDYLTTLIWDGAGSSLDPSTDLQPSHEAST